ncbi:MAG: DMT family transporter [Burkholderiales bacterium]
MKPADIAELLGLAALWGAAFLFMRLAGDFGTFGVALARAVGAALVLLPLLALRGEWSLLRRHGGPLFVLGLVSSALPFVLLAYATVILGAGAAAIFAATTPMWAAVISRLWLGDRLSRSRIAGLLVGFGGVAWLVTHQGNAPTLAGVTGGGWAAAACVAATALYGFSTVYTRKYLAGVPSMALAGGSQLASAMVLLVPGVWLWPQQSPRAGAWWALVVLTVACTGLAYLMFFHLVGRVGPASAVSVTFLVPAFAVGWGVLFLGERVTPPMLAGCAVVLLGTALSIGLLEARPGARPTRSDAP